MKRKNTAAILCTLFFAAVLVCLILFLPGILGKPTVYINEIMAENRSYPNGDKQLCPWIELYNGGKKPADLSAWTLSDGSRTFVFPEGSTLDAGAFLVLSCGKDSLPLSLSDGGTLELCDSQGKPADAFAFPALECDQSLARQTDGSYEQSFEASPGYENSSAGHEAFLAGLGVTQAPVQITELMPANKSSLLDADGNFSDWIELCNVSGEACDLDGFYLSDDSDDLLKWRFPSVSLVPGERMIVFCSDKDRTDGELHTNFSISSAGETLYLTSPAGLPLWSFTYQSAADDQSIVIVDGLQSLSYTATPGYDNSPEGYERLLTETDAHGALVINEAVLYNLDYYEQHHEYYDWVELKNCSDEPVNLADYYLTDSLNDPCQFPLPEKTLQPGEFYIVFCSGDVSLSTNHCTHAPFAISAEGEALYLFSSDGSLSDRMFIHDTPYGGSYGRLSEGSGFYYFDRPSPEKENGEGYRSIAALPEAGVPQGVYNDIVDLEVELLGEGKIYYTLDGSVPDLESQLYTEPLVLDQTTIIRAISVVDGKVDSDCASFSYFINEGHSLPVVSLVCEPADMFSAGQGGIYANPAVDKEVDASVAFFGEEGEFASDCAVTLHGASSRKMWQKKSFKLIFRSRYGGDLNYDVFQTGEITSFHSILLRGGGISSMHIVRDELGSEVADAVCDSALALDTRYCVLYINGEYFGVYALREAYSEKYVADHTGSHEENVTIARAPVKFGELYELFEYIIHHDMTDPECYAYASDRLDMASLANWMALEAYFNNFDIAGNIRYIKGDVPDSKWRLALFDLDISMTSVYAGWEQVFQPGYQIGQVTNSLRKSPQFRQTVLECASTLYHNGLTDSYMLSVYDDIIAQIDPEMERDCLRWHNSLDLWNWNVQVQRSRFCPERTSWWLKSLSDEFDFSEEEMQTYFGSQDNST